MVEEKYEVMCDIKGDKVNAMIITNEMNDIYKIYFKSQGYNTYAEGENFFYALLKLRKELELQDVKLLCKGCCRDVYPSPMILSMGDAIKAYKLTMGKHALTKDIVSIFDPCELDEYASIEEQYAYYLEWSKCKKI